MQKIFTGIDIGSSHVKVVIAAPGDQPDSPLSILGYGIAPSHGLRQGYIIDKKEAVKSVQEALGRAQAAAKMKITHARVSMGGISLEEVRSQGDISLTASGGTVTTREVERAVKESEKRAATKLVNRSVVHAIPLEYRLDGNPTLGAPIGLTGTKLAVDTLLVTMLSKHHNEILEVVEAAGVEVESVMASPIAASFVTLTKSQKIAGVVLANIGAETLSIIVYENDIPISLKVFPIGASSITDHIALSFQISLPEAEQAKRGAVLGSSISDSKIQIIVRARLKDMFSLIHAHLKTIGRQRLLPAGIVITGGGSSSSSAADVAKSVLRLPSLSNSIGSLPRSASIDATWAVAYGLCRWAYAEEMSGEDHTFSQVLQGGLDSVKNFFASLLP